MRAIEGKESHRKLGEPTKEGTQQNSWTAIREPQKASKAIENKENHTAGKDIESEENQMRL